MIGGWDLPVDLRRVGLGVALGVLVGVGGCRASVPGGVATTGPAPFAYPGWFLSTPLPLGSTAVGYAPNWRTTTVAESAAVANGQAALSAARRLRITWDAAFQSGMGVALTAMGERVREEPLMPPIDSVHLRASVETRGMRLVLVADPGSPGADVQGTSVVGVGREPSWVRSPPRERGVLYAVGVAPVTFREEIGWQEAERHARVQLAAAGATAVRALDQGAGAVGVTVMDLRSSAVLSEVHVVARWRDATTCFVLVHARIDPSGRGEG